jgi:hypothetical protein
MFPYFHKFNKRIISDELSQKLIEYFYDNENDFISLPDGNWYLARQEIKEFKEVSELIKSCNGACYGVVFIMQLPNTVVPRHVDGPSFRRSVLATPLLPYTNYPSTHFYENEYDGAGVGYEDVGRKLKNFKIDSYFNKQGQPAKGLEEEFSEMKKLDIPLFKKFSNVTDFLNWVKKYFNKRGEDIFRRVTKMKYVHGKPLSPFEPKPYKPTYVGTYQPKTQTTVKKEVPKKEDDPWADFEEGEMMGDWKFSKERGWYHVGEENGGKNDDDYYDYYNY